MFLDPQDGLTELVGICTLESHRRRGLAGSLTRTALVAAFARGVFVAFLSAADARAGRVYEAAGFTPFGNTVFAVAKGLAPLPPVGRKPCAAASTSSAATSRRFTSTRS